MQTVFLGYATEDYFFAELAEIKLENTGIRIWRDQDRLRAGSDWRHESKRASTIVSRSWWPSARVRPNPRT